MKRLAFCLLGSLLFLPSASEAQENGSLETPRLIVESPAQEGALSSVIVEVQVPGGELRRVPLRETAAPVAARDAGRDPRNEAAFVTWNEGESETWYAFSRDSGLSWSEAKQLATALKLRDGDTRPGIPMPAARGKLSLPADGDLFLVQTKTIILPEWKEALREAGVDLLQFFPNNAFISRLPRGLVGDVSKLDFVERIEPYHPSYRLQPELRDWMDSLDAAGDERMRVRAMTFGWGPEGKQRVLSDLQPIGVEVAEYWPSGHVLELWVTSSQLEALAAHPEITWVDIWGEREDDMDLVREDGGSNYVENNFNYCGQGVRGEVMDSGFQVNHQDFDTPTPVQHGNIDTSSHGTSCYGIVFGNGARDGDGQASALGHMPCPESTGIIADYSYLTDRFAHTQELKNSPYFASFQTNSWGDSRTLSYNSTSSEMDDIIWQLDISILQSQSNAGNQQSRPQAWAKNIISVGGIRHYNTLDTSDDAWNNGASIGPAEDGRIKPDINYWYDSIYTTTTNNGYTQFSGTSAATPESAGIVGLMIQMWADNVWNTDPVGASVFEKQPHASTIKALAINNANQYSFSGTSDDLTRVHQGWGRPSAQLAYDRAARSFIVDEAVNLQLGESASFDINVAAGEAELKITMIYPDPPGTTSASQHRINDLSLEVTSPGGSTTYHGNNGLDASNYSSSGGSPNTIDTVENVFIQNPQAGIWTVTVNAAEINQDAVTSTPESDATFALVVTGGVGDNVCGNGKLELGEECDGTDLGTATCATQGCAVGGTVTCNPDCTFNTAACTDCPVCGDGVCDFGEDCVSCGADCISQSAVSCGNGICEAADGEDCTTCAADCNGEQKGNPGNRYCCGAGGGEGPVSCTDSRCNDGGNICTDSLSFSYCCGDGTCEGAEGSGNCAQDCQPPAPSEAAAGAQPQLLVESYDTTTGLMTVSFGPACSSSDSMIVYGSLTQENLASYAWSGQECGVGVTGSYDWDTSSGPQMMFFAVVGQNLEEEGSYGKDAQGNERLPHTGNATCPLPQDVVQACGG